MNHTL